MLKIRILTLFSLFLIPSVTLVVQRSVPHKERSIIYAPWRDTTYATVTKGFQKKNDASSCPFCRQCAALNDAYSLILTRASHHFIIMNAYPYSKGHLLIIPYKHVANLKDLSAQAHSEMMDLCIKAMDILKEKLKPEGFNVGFNFGTIAGASVPHHLHMQIVPRYPGTPSFLDIIGNTTLVTFDMQQLYKELLPAFQRLNR